MKWKSRVEGPQWRDFRNEILYDFMIFIIGASSLHYAIQSRNDEEIVQLSDKLKTYVISDTGINLHPQPKNQAKTVQRILQDEVGAQDTDIIWHDVTNNTAMTRSKHGQPISSHSWIILSRTQQISTRESLMPLPIRRFRPKYCRGYPCAQSTENRQSCWHQPAAPRAF